MLRDFIVALMCLILAGILFVLPPDYLRSARLQIYALYSRVAGGVQNLEQEKNTEISAEVELPVRVRELTRQIILKDTEISRLKRDLRQFGDFRSTFPKVQIVPVRVLGYSGGADGQELVISCGRKQGVLKGDALAQGGTFAGVVSLVSDETSLVLPASHPGLVVATRIAGSDEICSVSGSGSQGAVVTIYASQSAAAVGDKVITSGLLGQVPEGLIVGTLLEYPRRGKEPGTLEAELKLEVNLSNISDLILIRSGSAEVPQDGSKG